MIRHIVGLDVGVEVDYTAYAVIEERKGFVCPITEKLLYECTHYCNAYPKGERIPGQGSVYYTGMVQTYCPGEHQDSEFTLVDIGQHKPRSSNKFAEIVELARKIEGSLYKKKPERRVELYADAQGLGMSLVTETMPEKLEHTKVIPVFTEGGEKERYEKGKWYVGKVRLMSNMIALRDKVRISKGLKNDPVLRELESQRQSFRATHGERPGTLKMEARSGHDDLVSAYALACWGVKTKIGRKVGRILSGGFY